MFAYVSRFGRGIAPIGAYLRQSVCIRVNEQEVLAMKQEWPLLYAFIFANKKNTSPFKLYAQLLTDHFQNQMYLEMSSVLKIVEILLVFSVSTASVEKFLNKAYNLIVTILRGNLHKVQKRS